MSTRNRNTGWIGLAVAVLAAVSTTACDPFIQPNTAAPQVLGVVVGPASAYGGMFYSTAADGCIPPYAEVNQAWADAAFPGLCSAANLLTTIPTVCPVLCYPPRTGPAFAPLFMGNLGGSYVKADGTSYTYAVQSTYVVQHVPPGVSVLEGVRFAKIRVMFNKLMDGKTIQPNPTDPARCIPAGGADGPKVYKATPASNPALGLEVTTTELWSICYDPNSGTDYWGGSMTAIPGNSTSPRLDPDTKYTIRAVVADQQGNTVPVSVEVLTDPLPTP
jgi:hypothetical protein